MYCGEEEATERICSPNGLDDKPSMWDVCKDCKEVIQQQQSLSFGAILAHMENDFSKNHGEKIMNKANKKLYEIAKRTKKPILNACIYKKKDGKYDAMSVEFTGEQNGNKD